MFALCSVSSFNYIKVNFENGLISGIFFLLHHFAFRFSTNACIPSCASSEIRDSASTRANFFSAFFGNRLVLNRLSIFLIF